MNPGVVVMIKSEGVDIFLKVVEVVFFEVVL